MKLGFRKGFALPTVLIVSVVMMMVLAVSVSATAASRQTLLTQYYDQLAQSAGDAGTAYAKACLSANNNVPTWSSAAPLTPNTDCTGTPVAGYPTYVTNYNDIRSSFSVGTPTVDADGRATTIPNSGYVQLLRTSTQTVWKTYTQPTFQSAVVPDLCTAGNTPSSAGWNNAVITTTTASNNIAGSQVISVSNAATINPGAMFFRKDFSVSLAGTYTEQLRADDGADVYVDGKLHWSSMSGYNTIVSNSINLTVGCHTIVVRLINGGTQPSTANFSYALTPQGGAIPKMVSDTSWRFSTGSTVPFSDSRYYQSSAWQPAVTQYTTSGNATWAAQAQWPDLTAGWVGATGGVVGGAVTYPSPQYTYLINNNSNAWRFSSPTTVKLYVQCDDSCRVFIDNNTTPVMTSTSWTTVTSQTFTLPEGQHRIAVELYNGAGGSGLLMTAINTTTNRVIDNTSDGQWTSNNAWSTTQSIPYSYDSTFLPSPDTLQPRYALNVLAVAGGGGGGDNGGGGGGAGGVNGTSNYNIYSGAAPLSLPVVVGDGGAGSTSGSAAGSNGANSIFGNNTFGLVTAYGGGGGASRDAGNQGMTGGSSGGGAGASTAPRQLSSVAIQGNIGANGAPPDSGCPAGGGGGGGAGSMGTNGYSGAGGNGGYGLTTTIGSYTFSYAGGGVGAITCNGSGSNGAIAPGFGGGAYASAATANTGGGGGGGSGDTASDYGGKGGSGFVYVWYVTGTITATATGGTSTTSGIYTILKFTSTTCTVSTPCYVNITALN